MKKTPFKLFISLVIGTLAATSISTTSGAAPTTYEYTVDCAMTSEVEVRSLSVPETATDFKLSFADNCVTWTVQGGNGNGLFINQTSHGAGFSMTGNNPLNWYGTVEAGGETGWVIGTIMATANDGSVLYEAGSNFSILTNTGGRMILVSVASDNGGDPEDPVEGVISTIYFKGNSKWLKRGDRSKLRSVVAAAVAFELTELNVAGFAPVTRVGSKAPDFAAIALSRAEEARKFLQRKFDQAEYEITLTVSGTASPRILKNKTYERKSMNRRVVISVPAPAES